MTNDDPPAVKAAHDIGLALRADGYTVGFDTSDVNDDFHEQVEQPKAMLDADSAGKRLTPTRPNTHPPRDATTRPASPFPPFPTGSGCHRPRPEKRGRVLSYRIAPSVMNPCVGNEPRPESVPSPLH